VKVEGGDVDRNLVCKYFGPCYPSQTSANAQFISNFYIMVMLVFRAETATSDWGHFCSLTPEI